MSKASRLSHNTVDRDLTKRSSSLSLSLCYSTATLVKAVFVGPRALLTHGQSATRERERERERESGGVGGVGEGEGVTRARAEQR
jgi:hypothetical protein